MPHPIDRRRRLRWLGASVVIVLGMAACGEDVPEPTFAERLQEFETDLTTEEVAEFEQLAALLCRTDPTVLVEVWKRSDTRQLEFHDLVVAQVCPDDLYQLYAGETERFAVDVAEE